VLARLALLRVLVLVRSGFVSRIAVQPNVRGGDRYLDARVGARHRRFLTFADLLRALDHLAAAAELYAVIGEDGRDHRRVTLGPTFTPLGIAFVDGLPHRRQSLRILGFRGPARGWSEGDQQS